MLLLKMGMDINQIIELWRGLSPRLARAIPSKELPNNEHTDEKECDEDSRDKTVGSIGSHYEENDV